MKSTPFFLLLFLFLLGDVLIAQQNRIANEYVAVTFEPATGRYALATLKGDPTYPSDDNRSFSGALLGTFAIIKIDDQYYKFGDASGKMLTRMIQADKSEHVWQIQNVEVKQEIRLSHSPYTVYPYNVNIKYWIKNIDSKPRKVGIRILVDSFLGLDDSIPFLIPEMQPVERELELNAVQVPDILCAWDNVSAPATRLLFNFVGKEVCKPDFLMFGNRKRLAGVMWDLVPETGKGFRNTPVEPADTAVSMRWEPIVFKPGYANGVAFDFGLANAAFNSRIPPIELLTLAPQRQAEEREFWIMAQALNSDAQRSIKNIKFQLELPPEIKIVTGNPEPVVSASLEGLKSQYYYWRVKAQKKGTFEYKLKATGLFNNQPAISMVPNKIVIE